MIKVSSASLAIFQGGPKFEARSRRNGIRHNNNKKKKKNDNNDNNDNVRYLAAKGKTGAAAGRGMDAELRHVLRGMQKMNDLRNNGAYWVALLV